MNKYEYSSFDEKDKLFAESTVINTREEFEAFRESIEKKEANTKLKLLFRGICESKFKLYTSFQRLWIDRNMAKTGINHIDVIAGMLDGCRKNVTLVNYFKSLGVIVNDWLLLSFLQHYGAISPLLDFTRDFKAALFFACDNVSYHGLKDDNDINNYVSVYYYKTVDVANVITKSVYSLAEKKAKLCTQPQPPTFWDDFAYKKLCGNYNIILVPSYANKSNLVGKTGNTVTTYTISNLNSTAQSGEFICNFNSDRPLEEFMVDGNGKKYLYKVEIHKGLIEYILSHYLNEDINALKEKYYLREEVIAKKIETEALKVI